MNTHRQNIEVPLQKLRSYFHSNLHEHSPIHLPLNAVLYVNRFCIHQRDSHQYNMVASQRIP